MSEEAKSNTATGHLIGLKATAWPLLHRNDSDSLRRRKLAVRVGHLTMAVLVFAAVGGGLIAGSPESQKVRVLILSLLSIAYIVWNLFGTAGIVQLVLWEGGSPPVIESRRPKCGPLVFFMVQLSLAAAIYLLADSGMVPNFVWIALLPPVAFAVFITEWRGIAVVTAIVLGVLAVNALRLHPWRMAVGGIVAFSFAVIFTLVFTLLAVHSEKSRLEVQRLASELTEANRQLREQAVHTEELAVSRERNRIAREIHDSIGHYLTGVNMQLEAARAAEPSNPSQTRLALAQAQLLTQEGMRDIRRSLATLRASPLENKTLVEGIQELLAQNGATGPQIEFKLIGTPRRLSPPAELSLYRAAQEGLTNVHKHAQAKHCKITLEFAPTARTLVSVIDDGLGSVAITDRTGFGLMGLRERANLLGGVLKTVSNPGMGFTLTMEVAG
ncbi:MAG: sensor histidine kinase [Verrucomicrobiota bacterium]